MSDFPIWGIIRRIRHDDTHSRPTPERAAHTQLRTNLPCSLAHSQQSEMSGLSGSVMRYKSLAVVANGDAKASAPAAKRQNKLDEDAQVRRRTCYVRQRRKRAREA